MASKHANAKQLSLTSLTLKNSLHDLHPGSCRQAWQSRWEQHGAKPDCHAC